MDLLTIKILCATIRMCCEFIFIEKGITMILKNGVVKTIEENGIIYQLIQTPSQEFGCDVFGLHLITDLFGSREEKKVEDITSDYEFAARMFDVFVREAVTPSVLVETIEDYLATNL